MAVLAHSSRRLPGPQPLHHTLGWARCARGGSRGWGERFYSGVCCLSASRGLGPPYSQVSHTLKQALFLSGLSQVEESIKPPDQGKRRHSGARSEIRRAPGARQRPLQRRTERRRPAMPALWLSCCLGFSLLLPAARATSGREGESASRSCDLAFLCTPRWPKAPPRMPTLSRTSLAHPPPPQPGAFPEPGFQ